MTASLCLLIGAALLVTSALLLRLRRCSDIEVFGMSAGPDSREEHDDLALEIGEHIFSPHDWQLVKRETSRRFADRFREERTLLALDWLRGVRGRVRSLVRKHRAVSRLDSSAKVTEELRLACQFFLFELTTAVLCGLILVQGPSGAAGLLGRSLDSAQRLKRIAQGPVGEAAPTGIAKTSR